MNPILTELRFEDVQPIWKEQLWPERTSKIEKISYISSSGIIDMQIGQWGTNPIFLGFTNNTEIVACVSSFQTNQHEYRCRGIWVQESFRSTGLGLKMIDALIEIIKKNDSQASTLWTMARLRSVGFYQRAQFKNQQIIEGYEYGPHQMMSRILDSQSMQSV